MSNITTCCLLLQTPSATYPVLNSTWFNTLMLKQVNKYRDSIFISFLLYGRKFPKQILCFFVDLEAFELSHLHNRLVKYLAGVSGSTVNFNSSPLNLSFKISKHLHESIQLNIFYNLGSKAFSQGRDEEAFSLDVDTEEIDHSHMLLSICTR